MKNMYVVRKTIGTDKYLYLHPNLGFVCEASNCGPYTFTSKTTARNKIKHANDYLYSGEKGKDEILTLEEYHAFLEKKLDSIEKLLHEHNYETHREPLKLYVYLTGERFGKPLHMWRDISLCQLRNIAKELESDDTNN